MQRAHVDDLQDIEMYKSPTLDIAMDVDEPAMVHMQGKMDDMDEDVEHNRECN